MRDDTVTRQFFVVDRIEGRTVVLVGDDDSTHERSKGSLRVRGVREGDVLSVNFRGGVPDWTSATVDRAEKARRLREVRGVLDQLKASDPGGDISL